jgi:hypothetical protein
MTLVSSANNIGSDTEFIFMRGPFTYIMSTTDPRINPWGTPVSMYPSQRKKFELN